MSLNDSPPTKFDVDAGRTVAMYRNSLVAASEPYIVDQPLAVPRYVPHWFGHRRGRGQAPPLAQTTISSWGTYRLRRCVFLLGYDPTINRALRQLKPSLVHAHFGPDAMFAASTARRMKIPLVVTFHGYDATRPDVAHPTIGTRLWQRRRVDVFAQAELILAVSDFVADSLLALGAPANKVVRHYVGVDTERFAPATHAAAARVLFVGRLSEVKGITDAIRAMAIVRAAIPQATLTVVGDGPLRDEVARLDCELAVNAQLLGALDHDEVVAQMGRADLFCAPSRATLDGQREGLGLVFVEAHACGVPVVSCRSGGIAEVVEHGVTGLLTDEGDVDAIAAAIIELLTDDEQRRQFGIAARQRAVRDFDLHRQSAVLADLYDRVLQ